MHDKQGKPFSGREVMRQIVLGVFYSERPEPDKQKSLESVSEALRLALPLVETLPYTQEYIDTALNVVTAWGIDPDEFVKQLAMNE